MLSACEMMRNQEESKKRLNQKKRKLRRRKENKSKKMEKEVEHNNNQTIQTVEQPQSQEQSVPTTRNNRYHKIVSLSKMSKVQQNKRPQKLNPPLFESSTLNWTNSMRIDIVNLRK